MDLRKDCDYIVKKSIQHVMPDTAVKRALTDLRIPDGKLILVSVGKAAWSMAKAAWEQLGEKISSGIVITKHGYSQGAIGNLMIYEAGHPVPDADSFHATDVALRLTDGLSEKDLILFLLSGGGSALFEAPLISAEELQSVTDTLLDSGADIVEINTIRKRLSAVKAGRFAIHCLPARVYSIVLSDIIGDPLDMIASGPAYPDSSTKEDAERIIRHYSLKLSDQALAQIESETPKELRNVDTVVTGSVRELCVAAAEACADLGYEPVILTDCLNCEAREAGRFLASVARSHQKPENALAFLAGGETVVHVHGHGKGGRNQELALSAAGEIDGLPETAVFSFGSDGTDGPTDAAGGYADGNTASLLRKKGVNLSQELSDNNTYFALKSADGLIFTGPTGTNVNDISIVLLKG